MNFENGGDFSKPVFGHTYFRVREGYAWVFSGIEKELERLGYWVDYESGYIGRDSSEQPVTMSIEVFVGEVSEGEVVEASFDLTIEEAEPDKGQLTIAAMPGPFEVPGVSYRDDSGGREVSIVPDDALVAMVTGKIHEMAEVLIPAYKAAGRYVQHVFTVRSRSFASHRIVCENVARAVAQGPLLQDLRGVTGIRSPSGGLGCRLHLLARLPVRG
jgi:hypothetical protein